MSSHYQNINKTKKSVAVAGLIVFVLILLWNTLYMLDQREIGLVLQFGKPVERVDDAGLHYKIPFMRNVVFFDKRIQTLFFAPSGINKEVMAVDQKTMKLTAYTKYKIVDPLVFYEKVRDKALLERHIMPIIESSIREVVGTFTFIDVLGSKRSEINERIIELVKKQAALFGVDIIDIQIMKVNLPDKAKKAVYERMKTDREKEAREIRALGVEESEKIKAVAERDRVIIVSRAHSDAEILRGEGEAEAAEILAVSAAQDPEFFAFYRLLNAYKSALPNDNTAFVMSTDSDFFRYLNIR